MKSATAASGASHANWLPMLEAATREVFELMLNSQLSPPEVPTEEPHDITAMVGLAGKLCGVLIVRSNAKSAARMGAKMLGMDLAEGSPEISDALGEICNMVAGNFKNKIPELGDGCMLSPPTVVLGRDYTMHSLADTSGLELRLLFESMPLQIVLKISAS